MRRLQGIPSSLGDSSLDINGDNKVDESEKAAGLIRRELAQKFLDTGLDFDLLISMWSQGTERHQEVSDEGPSTKRLRMKPKHFLNPHQLAAENHLIFAILMTASEYDQMLEADLKLGAKIGAHSDALESSHESSKSIEVLSRITTLFVLEPHAADSVLPNRRLITHSWDGEYISSTMPV